MLEQIIICHIVSVTYECIKVRTVHLNKLSVVGLFSVDCDNIDKRSTHNNCRQAHYHIKCRDYKEMQNRNFLCRNPVIKQNWDDEYGLQLECKRNADEHKRCNRLVFVQKQDCKDYKRGVKLIALSPKR